MEASSFAFAKTKALISRSAGKVMAIIFCDIQGIILNHFVPPKTTVTGNYYASVIKSDLLPGIKRKRPQLMRSGILLHHDNAPSHSSCVVLDTIKELDIEILPRPPVQPRFGNLRFLAISKSKK